MSAATIGNAGGLKALDLQLTINATSGFLLDESIVAYRVIWGINDNNNNLILGTPSQRNVITNQTGSSKTVDLRFTTPQNTTTSYFYQIYRTTITTAVAGISLSDLDPGDEDQLVYEANVTATNISNGYVDVHDITPESFLGGYLYTNEASGEGIAQANEVPPLASDITLYKGYTFYANTSTKQRKTFSLLSVATHHVHLS
jgi:hypothetical protein